MIRSRPMLLRACAVAAVCLLAASGCGSDGEASATDDAPPDDVTTTTKAPIVAPLTGEVDATGESVARPVLTVKVENTEAALPQAGVDAADVVYEEVVEGGITRLAAMFNSHAPDKIGPIRSVRNTDQAIVWPVGGIFAYSGGARVSVESISAAPVTLVDESSAGDAMFRDGARRRPHNLFGNGPALFAIGGEPVPPPALFTYRAPDAAAAGEVASAFTVGFTAGNAVTWTWHAASGRYVRNVFGGDQESEDGAPIAPDNVIVQFVDYAGGAGAEGSEATMVGRGDAWVFTGGHVVKGTWERAAKEAPTRYLDAAGAPIPLAPGQTWVELPQIGYDVSVGGAATTG